MINASPRNPKREKSKRIVFTALVSIGEAKLQLETAMYIGSDFWQMTGLKPDAVDEVQLMQYALLKASRGLLFRQEDIDGFDAEIQKNLALQTKPYGHHSIKAALQRLDTILDTVIIEQEEESVNE